MSRLIRELFHGSSYRHHPQYYYDDAVVSYGAGRNMMPDVVLHVPMDSSKCMERVKYALAIQGIDQRVQIPSSHTPVPPPMFVPGGCLFFVQGVHRVICDMVNQTVTVSGNIAPEALLRRVRRIKRHSHILSYSSPYAGSSYGGYPTIHNPYANERYPMSPPFGSAYDGYLPNYDDYDSAYRYDDYGPSSAYSYY